MDLASLSSTAVRYSHTLRHLRARQLLFQSVSRVRGALDRRFAGKPLGHVPCTGTSLLFAPFVEKYPSLGAAGFTFLNQTQSFGGDIDAIDWEFNGYGKLWAYNLNYFDFLLQPGADRYAGISLIEAFIAGVLMGSTGLEPYPISLRGINWIKFLSLHRVSLADIDASLHAQYRLLLRRLEYHLLGNHLLENAFSLLFGACYFREDAWYQKAQRLLRSELDEQVLGDGAHFELSPMYHQILLDRLLDCVNLLQHNRCFEGQDTLLSFLVGKAHVMLDWLRAISFADGSIPHLNDATDGIAPATAELFAYAGRLCIGGDAAAASVPLRESGYRKFVGSKYECVVDVGRIGPDYIPGHAHADTLNFVMQVDGKPFLVDTGLSTYEAGRARDEERGTGAHNTVVVNGGNSSDVWGGFRVGRRARVSVLEDACSAVTAEHDGYRRFGVVHRRRWEFDDRRIVVVDQVTGASVAAEARFHFDGALLPVVDGLGVRVPGACLTFSGARQLRLVPYRQAMGFNWSVSAWCAVVRFDQDLATEISIGCA